MRSGSLLPNAARRMTMRTLACCLWVLGCAGWLGCDGGSNKNQGDVADSSGDAVGDSDAAADAAGDSDVVADPCDGVTCSGAGTCVAVEGAASCDCDADYAAVELTCIQTKMVPCVDDAPAHASADTSVEVEVSYTDAGGWSAPAACGWSCDSGWTVVGERCLAVDFVDTQCRLACAEWESCGVLGDESFESCLVDCLDAAEDSDAFARAVCVGMSYEHDGLWCGVVESCDTLASGDPCAARCAAIMCPSATMKWALSSARMTPRCRSSSTRSGVRPCPKLTSKAGWWGFCPTQSRICARARGASSNACWTPGATSRP